MARAKRTDKAEARRKYRAYLQAQAEAESATADQTEDDGPAPARRSLFGMGARPAASTAPAATSAAAVPAAAARPRTAPSASASAAAATPPAGQMNFFKAMGAAYKPVHYRDDLRFLPTLLTTTFGVWAGIAVAIAGTALFLAAPSGTDSLAGIATLALAPMPLVPVMLAGVMTQRAAWLAGAISGGVAGLGTLVIFLVQPAKILTASAAQGADRLGQSLYLMVLAICFGALFGALSAWYRRFLTLSMGPNKRQQQSKRNSRSSSRPAKRPTR